MFGPLAPIKPVPVDVPGPGEDRPDPRRWQYPVGWDMPMGMPGTEGVGKLANFQTLRTIADYYSVARGCIELRKAEIRGIKWEIASTKNAAKAMRGDHGAMKDFAVRQATVTRFFRRPDKQYPDFSTWLDAALEEVFVTDALTLYPHPARGKGKGVLGSNLAALELLDGSLIRPLVDIRGSTPQPPNVGYQQFLYGVPRVDLMTMVLGDDIPGAEHLAAEYRSDQIMYLPSHPRTWSPYGFTSVERGIIPIMTGIAKQKFALDFFQEGSIPGLFVSPGDANMSPNQIRELQDALNAVAGDQAWKHKIIVLPGGSRVDPQKPITLADQFDQIVMLQVCMAFDCMPMELGILPNVSATTTPSTVTMMSKANQQIHQRKSTVPLLEWLKSAIFDVIIQDVLGQEDMEWRWEGLEEAEDEEALTSLIVEQVGAGLASIDEGRMELGREPWGLEITQDPGWATQFGGFQSLTALAAMGAAGGMGPGTQGQQGQQGKRPAGAGSGEMPGELPPTGMTARPRNTMSHGQRSQHATTVGLAAHAPGAATPAHSGAAAAHAGTRRAGSTKGAGRELSLLRTHLRKGAPVRDWAPRDIPGAVLAMITEDIAKGLSADQACDIAAGVLGKAAGSPQLPAAGGIIPGAQSSPQQSWQGWYSDMQLAAEYAPQIAAALSSAVSAPLLARRWLAQAQAGAYPAGIGNAAAGASTPPAPRAFLNAAGVTAALAGALAAILGALWGAAWAAGWSAALAALGGNGPQAPGDPADLIRSGQSRMDGILATRLALLEQALLDALRNGESEDALAARIADILGSLPGALLISRSEVTWASSAAALEVYRKAGITWKRWVTRNDAKVCPRCKANQAAGSVPLDAMFPSGTLAPLAHPNCRCSVLPSAGPQAAKDAADLTDPNPVEAEHVLSLMRANFPDKALGWVEDVHWIGPVHVPLSRVDFRDEDSWAASHQPERVADFARQIENGDGYAHPVILVQTPHDQKAVIIDGHHRVLACRKLGWPAKAYLGMADTLTSPMLETHSSQVHQGSSPLNKGTDAPVAAGLAVRAASTGRILMLQRAMTEDDPVAGLWEFPGGRLEDGESALEAARREWAEETGCEPPRSDPDGIWNSADGRYRGFVITVADESAVDAFGPRDEVANPDDPDGDLTEALAWLDPVHLKDNPSIRPELAEDQKRVRRALKGAGRSISQSPELPGPLIE